VNCAYNCRADYIPNVNSTCCRQLAARPEGSEEHEATKQRVMQLLDDIEPPKLVPRQKL
jgi:hypothetical protein